MNIGQILECHLGWAAGRLGFMAETPVFDGATEEEIWGWLGRAGLPDDGKITLYDGRTGETFHSRVTVGAVLLAAGSGSRMGHRPKCLLELDGVPLIHRLLIALNGAGIDQVVVVLGRSATPVDRFAGIGAHRIEESGGGQGLQGPVHRRQSDVLTPTAQFVVQFLCRTEAVDVVEQGDDPGALAGRPHRSAGRGARIAIGNHFHLRFHER
jgi:hypothetical protein